MNNEMTETEYHTLLEAGVVAPEDFKPFVLAIPNGDLITVHWSPEAYKAKWIGPHLTLPYGRDTKEVVGLSINSLSNLKAGEPAQ